MAATLAETSSTPEYPPVAPKQKSPTQALICSPPFIKKYHRSHRPREARPANFPQYARHSSSRKRRRTYVHIVSIQNSSEKSFLPYPVISFISIICRARKRRRTYVHIVSIQNSSEKSFLPYPAISFISIICRARKRRRTYVHIVSIQNSSKKNLLPYPAISFISIICRTRKRSRTYVHAISIQNSSAKSFTSCLQAIVCGKTFFIIPCRNQIFQHIEVRMNFMRTYCLC